MRRKPLEASDIVVAVIVPNVLQDRDHREPTAVRKQRTSQRPIDPAGAQELVQKNKTLPLLPGKYPVGEGGLAGRLRHQGSWRRIELRVSLVVFEILVVAAVGGHDKLILWMCRIQFAKDHARTVEIARDELERSLQFRRLAGATIDGFDDLCFQLWLSRHFSRRCETASISTLDAKGRAVLPERVGNSISQRTSLRRLQVERIAGGRMPNISSIAKLVPWKPSRP